MMKLITESFLFFKITLHARNKNCLKVGYWFGLFVLMAVNLQLLFNDETLFREEQLG